MAVGRPRTFDADDALQRALDCFWSQGFASTSMEDLLRSTGLSKSSLYESFGSKRTLFERCLARYRKDRVALMCERLASAETGIGFITQMLESVAAECSTGKPRGCLVMNTATEFAQKDPEIARLVRESIAAFRSVFRRAIRQAQAEGDIPAHKDAAVLARFVVTNMSGLRTLAKAGTSERDLKATIRVVIAGLRS